MAFDSGMAKMLIFCFVFIGSFALMLPLIPGEFAVSTKEYSDLAGGVPDYWNGISLMRYNLTDAWNMTLAYPMDYQENFDTGGRNLGLKIFAIASPYRLILVHRYGFNLWWEEAMDWYNELGQKRSSDYLTYAAIWTTQLDEDYESFDQLQYTVKCLGLGQGSSTFQVMVFFYVNSTLYDSPSDAWVNDDLDILVGVDIDNENTALDAWHLISSLMTFNTMEVFGSSGAELLALNALIALPIWATIIIPAAVFTLEALDRILPL